MNGPQRVVFVLPDLHGGGTQRVVLRLLKHLDRSRFEPTLLVLEGRGALLDEIPRGLRWEDCGKRRAGLDFAWWRRLRRRIDAIAPSVAIGFLWYANVALLRAARCPVVVSERNTIRGDRGPTAVRWIRRSMIRREYPSAELVVANSEALRRELVDDFGLSSERVVYIGNPIPLGPRPKWKGGGLFGAPVVVGMGRLVHQKGFETAVRALARAPTVGRLVLLGEGPDRGRLEDLARRLGVASRLEMPGFVRDPAPWLEEADLFLLSSRWEGSPNALLEAMAAGCPCVATDCPTGPAELIRHGDNGWLVEPEDPLGLAAAMEHVLGDRDLAGRLGRQARRSLEELEAGRVTRRFEASFEEVARRSSAEREDPRRSSG